MIANNKGATLVGIVVGVFILSITLLGVARMIYYNKEFIYEYDKKEIIDSITNNTYNILEKLDLSNINTGEDFYLYKDTINKEFLIFTGTTNQDYIYIDSSGEKIDDISNYSRLILTRIINIDRVNIGIGDDENIINVNVKEYIKK